MTSNIKQAIEYFENHKSDVLESFREYLTIPSISTDSLYNADLNHAAEWLKNQLVSLGIQNVMIIETKKNPIVYGEYLKAGLSKPVVLIYGHYDVQPPDPIEQWESDPFLPVEKDGRLYARGASDMKGQLMISLAAINAIMQTNDFPVNLKFLIEGEEEIGSPSMKSFLNEYKELLRSNFVLNLDAGMVAADVPTIVYGLRGLAYFEIEIYGPSHDLHSGLFGGIVYNPAQALCEILSKMKDQDGVIRLPGFYDNVIELSEEEKQKINMLPIHEQDYLTQTGSISLWGERDYTILERLGARPTLEINGMISGYTGEGPKTIIPSKAMAKISTRLVPDQTPDQVHEQLVKFMEVNAPTHVRWEVKLITSDLPCLIDPHFKPTQEYAKALEEVWKIKPVFKREGGSIPIVSDTKTILGINTVLSGFSLPDDRIHGPNEHIQLDVWEKGIQAIINFFFNIEKEL